MKLEKLALGQRPYYYQRYCYILADFFKNLKVLDETKMTYQALCEHLGSFAEPELKRHLLDH